MAGLLFVLPLLHSKSTPTNCRLLTQSFVRYQLVQTSYSRVPFSHWWYRRRFPSTQESNCQRAYSLSLPVKRAGNLFSYQIWWYLVVVVVVVEIACQFMISLVIHSRGFHVTLTFFSLVDSVEIPLSDRWPACSFEGQWFSSRVKGLEGDWVMTFFLKCQAWRKWHLKLGSYVCGRGIPSDSRGGFLLTLTVFDVKLETS